MIYIFNSWNLDCDPGFHGVFCKTIIIRQLKKEMNWKSKKIRKNAEKNRWRFIWMFTCGCDVWACVCVCGGGVAYDDHYTLFIRNTNYFCLYFSIFDSFHFLNCLMICCFAKKTPWNPGSQSKFQELDIYIFNIYSFIIVIYNSSILDIEHSPYYIALGSTHTHKVIQWQQHCFIVYNIVYIYIYTSIDVYMYLAPICKNSRSLLKEICVLYNISTSFCIRRAATHKKNIIWSNYLPIAIIYIYILYILYIYYSFLLTLGMAQAWMYEVHREDWHANDGLLIEFTNHYTTGIYIYR